MADEKSTTNSNLTREDTEHVARLARLALSAEEVNKYQLELNSVLEVVKSLNEIDTANLPETAQVSGLVNVARADEAQAELSQADALLNAPQTDGKHFTVPGVL